MAAKKQEPRRILQNSIFLIVFHSLSVKALKKSFPSFLNGSAMGAESIINKVVMTENAAGSGYYYPDKTLYLHLSAKAVMLFTSMATH